MRGARVLTFRRCGSRSRSSTRGSATLPATRAQCSTRSAKAERDGAALVVTPELSLCGYPPEDLLLRPAFLDACASELAALAAASARHDGRSSAFPSIDGGRALQRGRRPARRPRRRRLSQAAPAQLHGLRRGPLLRRPAPTPCVFDVDGVCAAASSSARTCWFAGSGATVARSRARKLIIVPNGSPYHTRQQAARARRSTRAPARRGVPFVYVNRVGGQDELVFDGASFVMDANGTIVAAAAGVARDARRRGLRRCGAATRARRARPRTRAARLSGAGDGRARLRGEEPLSGRAARPVGWRRFCVDARGRRRCARRRSRARRDDAVAIQRGDQPRGRPRNGGDRRRALRRDRRSGRCSTRFSARSPESSRGCRRMPPRKTSRRAFAARC